MPTPTVTPTVLDTVLGHLAPHFMAAAGNDLPTARHAASRTLADYDIETEEELRLAGEIVSFGFHSLEALSEAAAPDLSMNRKLRLRGSAVSLSRQAHKSQRKLDQLRRARLLPPAPKPPIHAKSDTAQPLGLIDFACEPIEATAKPGGVQTRIVSRQQRRAAERIAEKLRRNKAEHDRREAMKAVRAANAPPQRTAHQAAV